LQDIRPKNNSQSSAKGSPRRNAQNIGVSKGVSQNPLHNCPGACQAESSQNRQKNSGQAQIKDYRFSKCRILSGIRRYNSAEDNLENLLRANAGTTNNNRCQNSEEQNQQQTNNKIFFCGC
jgi:hypothetical protein